jgi:polyisoprenoid-binding protein YceI
LINVETLNYLSLRKPLYLTRVKQTYMKKLFFAAAMLAVSAGVISFIPAKKFADTLTVDVAKSKIDWFGAAADHYHPGTVNLKSGTVTVDNNKITGGEFVIDLTSAKSTDGAGERLDGAIKSPNMFDVAKFGEATFKITGVSYTSDNAADLSGNLTVKGATVAVKVPAKIRSSKDGKLFAEAFFSLDAPSIGIQRYTIDLAVHIIAAK